MLVKNVWSFVAVLQEAMDLAEFCIKSTLSHVLESCKLDLELLQSAGILFFFFLLADM